MLPTSPEIPYDYSISSPTPAQAPEDSDFVRVREWIPEIRVDLAYAADDNFTGQAIYDFSDAWLRYGTVKKLAAAQAALAEQGLGLLIWDAFRPVSAQYRLWEICPDPVYVADPNRGGSSHSRGNTVDITLVDAAGTALRMPSDFDNFSPLADRDYSDADPEAAEHARLLESVMEAAGFRGYSGEWWHFSDRDIYPVDPDFSPTDME